MAGRIEGVYLPRNPKASPLYGLVEDHFDEFERVYDDRFAEKHGFWRPVIRKVVNRFLDCGDLRHGFARIRCENPECGHEMLLAFSCHGRYFCPSCHAKRVAAFADWMAAEVLADVPHRQVVFTIPKLLRLHFRFDRKLLGLLSSCAYAAIREMMQAVSGDPRSVPGVVTSLQTFGDLTANWHPHCHSIVTDGVFRPDGSFQPLPVPDSQPLMLLFRHKLLQELLRLEKITTTTIEILDRFRHTGFSVYQGPPVLPGDTAAREKLAVYVARAPISLDRLSYDSPNGTVDYRPKSSPGHPLLADDAPHQDPLDVLAALCDQIPNKGQQLTRYLGWYSNKSRGLRKKAEMAAADASPQNIAVSLENPIPNANQEADHQEAEDTPYRKACRRTWAQLIEKVYLISPLICPQCNSPMKIISFIEDPPVIRKILKHLGIWETQPRPPPKKTISSCTVEPIAEESLPWAGDPIYEYDNIDPVYED
jgi:hypothetical protein